MENPALCCVELIQKVAGGHQQGDGLAREREIAPIQTTPDLLQPSFFITLCRCTPLITWRAPGRVDKTGGNLFCFQRSIVTSTNRR